MRWTRQRRRGRCSQGGLSRERTTSRRTYGADAYGKTVWFWHPWLVSSCRWRSSIQPDRSAIKPAAMEAKGIRLQGELGISRQTIAQGMPECSGCTCMLVCASLRTSLHTRPRVQRAPGIPCSLFSRRDKVHANLGRSAPREREHISAVIASAASNRDRRRMTEYSCARNDRIDRPRRTGYPACVGYDGPLATRQNPPRPERDPGFANTGHAHVKARLSGLKLTMTD